MFRSGQAEAKRQSPVRRYFEFITAHPVAVLSIFTLIGLAFVPFILNLTRDTSPDAFIPPGHPAVELKRQVEESFGVTEPIAVAIIRDRPGGIFRPDTLRLIQHLTQAVQQLPDVTPGEVISLATEYSVYFGDDGEPGFDRLMKRIPETPDELTALKDDVLGYELFRGTLVAADGSAACIVIPLRNEERADEVYRAIAKLLRETPVTDEQLVIAGEPVVRTIMGRAVSDDALRMNLVCPVAMAILIILAYRTVRATVITLAAVGGASALALGLMSASHVPIYIVTNGIFVVIMALAVDNSFHLIGQYYEEQLDLRARNKQEIIVDACMLLWFPIVITSFTDLAGFVGLYTGGLMPPIRYFGLFTCIGVLGALLYWGTVVPAGLMIRPLRMSPVFLKRRNASTLADADWVGAALGGCAELAFRRHARVLAIGTVVLAVSGWGASKLVINDARILAFKDDHPLVQASRILNQRFDGTTHLNILVSAAGTGALLRHDVLQQISDLEAFTETLPRVGGTHSIAGWVKRAHQKMHDEDPAFYAIPDDPEDTRYYLDVLGGATSPMARLLHEVIDPTYTHANLVVRMRSSEFIHERAVIRPLQAYLDRHFAVGPLRAQLAGRANLDYQWLSLIGASHARSVLPSLFCVLVLTGLMFRSVAAGILCTVTASVAVVIIYALMGFGGIPLGVGSSMFASIAIGSGVNFPVHILDRLRLGLRAPNAIPILVFREALSSAGRPLFFTALVIGAGFLLLCVSEFRTLNEFGLLIGTAMLVSFATSVMLLPALLVAIKPAFVWRQPRKT